MRLLFWIDAFWPHIGGIEVRAMRLIAGLCERGHPCAVITSRVPEELPKFEIAEGVAVHRFEFPQVLKSYDLREMHRIGSEIRELKSAFRPNLEEVFVSGPILGFQQMFNRPNPVPTVASLQGKVEDFQAARRFLGLSAAVITVSDYLRSKVCLSMPELASRTVLLRNCLPFPTLLPDPLPIDPPVILCLGRLVSIKGFDLALRALARLGKRWDHVKMIVAGDGPERQPLEQLAAELGIGHRVKFTGWVDPSQVPAFLNQSSFAVVPSRWQEAFGLVSLQASQMARPVIASRMGGIPEVIAHGETGLLVNNEDVTGLAAAFTDLLEDPDRMKALGIRGRQRALDEFGFDKYLSRHVELFRLHACSD